MRCKILITVVLFLYVSSLPLAVAASDAGEPGNTSESAGQGKQDESDAAKTEAEAEARKKAARQYFKRGTRLFDTGEYAQAAELFVLAYKEAPHPIVLANVGLSYDKAGRLPQAVTAYRQYLRDQDDDVMRKRLQELEKQVGELQITCADGDVCSIKVDGTKRGDTPLNLVVYPGPHQVEATSEGRLPALEKANVKPGEQVAVALALAPIPETTSDAQPSGQKTGKNAPYGLGIPFWVSVGVTGVAGVMAITFGALTINTKQEFEDTGSTDEALKDKGENQKVATNVMIGITAAAALTAAGFAIYDLVYKKGKEKPPQGAEIAIVPGPGVGIGAVVTF